MHKISPITFQKLFSMLNLHQSCHKEFMKHRNCPICYIYSFYWAWAIGSLLPLKKPSYNGVKKKIAWIKIKGWLLLQMYQTWKEYFTFIFPTMSFSYWMVRDHPLNFSSNMITWSLLNSRWKCRPLRYVAMQSSSCIFCPLSFIKTSHVTWDNVTSLALPL